MFCVFHLICEGLFRSFITVRKGIKEKKVSVSAMWRYILIIESAQNAIKYAQNRLSLIRLLVKK